MDDSRDSREQMLLCLDTLNEIGNDLRMELQGTLNVSKDTQYEFDCLVDMSVFTA